MNYFYINTQTFEYPLYEGDVRLEYTNIGDVFELPSDCIFKRVDIMPLPEIDDSTQILVFNTPVCTDGVWTQEVTIRDLTTEELQIRTEMLAQRTQQGWT